jgi:hypothetical protein
MRTNFTPESHARVRAEAERVGQWAEREDAEMVKRIEGAKWNSMELFDINDKHILFTPSYSRTMS